MCVLDRWHPIPLDLIPLGTAGGVCRRCGTLCLIYHPTLGKRPITIHVVLIGVACDSQAARLWGEEEAGQARQQESWLWAQTVAARLCGCQAVYTCRQVATHLVLLLLLLLLSPLLQQQRMQEDGGYPQLCNMWFGCWDQGRETAAAHRRQGRWCSSRQQPSAWCDSVCLTRLPPTDHQGKTHPTFPIQYTLDMPHTPKLPPTTAWPGHGPFVLLVTRDGV
jgi:hypothetical protein